MKIADKLMPRKSVTGRDGYRFYKKHCNKQHRTEKINILNHSTIVRAICKKIADKLLENKSGVYLHNFGYLAIMMYPKRMMIRDKASKTGGKHFNLETDHRIYSPQWIKTENYPPYFPWTLDRTFSDTNIRKPLSKKLKSGKKYTLEYKLVKSYKKA